jgi:hypothetical protein
MPSAEKLPGSFGMMTVGIEISRAIATGMQRAGAAERDHGVSRGSTPVDRDCAHRKRHGRIGDGSNAERRSHGTSRPSGEADFGAIAFSRSVLSSCMPPFEETIAD